MRSFGVPGCIGVLWPCLSVDQSASLMYRIIRIQNCTYFQSMTCEYMTGDYMISINHAFTIFLNVDHHTSSQNAYNTAQPNDTAARRQVSKLVKEGFPSSTLTFILGSHYQGNIVIGVRTEKSSI